MNSTQNKYYVKFHTHHQHEHKNYSKQILILKTPNKFSNLLIKITYSRDNFRFSILHATHVRKDTTRRQLPRQISRQLSLEI